MLFPFATFSLLGGWCSSVGCWGLDPVGEGQLLKSAGFQYFCCLGVYPHPGWKPGGCYGLPGLLCCHPGAEELSVHGEKLIP